MELRQYIQIAWKWLWLIVLAVAIASLTSYVASRASTPLYRTKTTLLVGPSTQNLNLNTYDLYMGQQLALTYAQLVDREPVLKGVIENLGLKMKWDQLAWRVSANAVPNTQLIEINVIDSDPYRAKVLADAVAQQLILQSPTGPSSLSQEQSSFISNQLEDLQGKIQNAQEDISRLKQELDATNSARQIQDLNSQIALQENKVSEWQNTYSQLIITQGGNGNSLTILEQAIVPTSPVSPNVQMNVIVAAGIGFMLAVAGAFLVEYLDDTIKSPEDVLRTANLPVLGAIARIEGETYPDKLIAARHPLSPTVEAYRVVRTNIQFSSIDHPARSLMVTSPGPSEGKSIIAANLAVVLAQSGLNVVLADTDLRRPVQHRIFGLPNRDGFGDAVLQTQVGIRDHLQKTSVENLFLLSSGSLPPNPAELLGSDRMKTIIEELRNFVDVVLFDSPPVLVVADAAILGAQVDGVILVNDIGNTRSNEAKRAAEELRRARANLLGVVLNRLHGGGRGSYYYYNYSYYMDEGSKKVTRRAVKVGRQTTPLSKTAEKPKEVGRETR